MLESDLKLGLLGGNTRELSLEGKRIILDAREGFLVCGLEDKSVGYCSVPGARRHTICALRLRSTS